MSAAMNVRVCICGLALWCIGHLRPRVISLSANDSLRAQCPRNTRSYCLILLWIPAILNTSYTHRSSRWSTSERESSCSPSVSYCGGNIMKNKGERVEEQWDR
jgi:hypothetical protein